MGQPDGGDFLRAEFGRLLEMAVDGRTDVLPAVVDVGERLLATGPDDRADLLHLLGLGYVDLVDAGQTEHLDRLVEVYRELRALLPADHPEATATTLRLGLALTARLTTRAGFDPAGTTEAIDALEAVLDEVGQDLLPVLRLRLGHLYALRALNSALATALTGAGNTARTGARTGAGRGDAAADRERARTLLDPLTDDPDTADAARLVLAWLAIAPSPGQDIRAGGPDQHATAAALEHLRALDDQDAARLPSALLALSTAHGDPTALRAAIDQLAEHRQDLAVDSQETAVFTGLLTALEIPLAEAENGARKDPSTSIDTILDALDDSADQESRAVLVELLGAVAASPVPLSVADLTDQPAAAGALRRLDRVMAVLDPHPVRTKALVLLALRVLLPALTHRDGPALRRLREHLAADRAEPATSDLDEAFRSLQLGLALAGEGLYDSRPDQVDAALELVGDAAARIPDDHEARVLLGPHIGMLLVQRYLVGRSIEDIDAVPYFTRPPGRPATSTPAHRSLELWSSRLQSIVLRLLRPWSNRAEDLDQLIADADQVLAETTDLDFARHGWDQMREFLVMVRSAYDGDGFDFPRLGPRLARFRAAGDRILARIPPDGTGTAQQAQVLVGLGFAGRDLARLDQGLALLTDLCADQDKSVHELFEQLGALGAGYRMRHLVSRRPADLEHAIAPLERARLLAIGEPGLRDTAATLYQLAECYVARRDEHRHDLRRAVDRGLDALAARMREVLLQTGPGRAMDAARAAAGEAADVALWCVTAGDHEAAVRALELGRAMVLRSATADADVSGLLRAAGRTELAQRWEDHLGQDTPWDSREPAGPVDPGTTPPPSTVRREMLAAVEGTVLERRLLSPPTVAEIAATLRAARATALVYLVGTDDTRGLALVVRADGTVDELWLPGLHTRAGGPVRAFERAQLDLTTTPGQDTDRRWASTAAETSAWAWTTAMGPVLDRVLPAARQFPVRLVLIPVGRLGAVPWHAAARPVDGGTRYACQDAVIAYAASARQFLDARRLRPRPWPSAAALVGVAATDTPRDTLFWVEEELDELRRRYPDAVEPADGRVLPADVAALLPRRGSPGASLLHLSCHGVRVDPPVESHLLLDGGSRLPVREILRQASDRPADLAGPLVVLAACVTDLAGDVHDEALTLATAFLAAGAAGVLGARWPVPDLPTALFMVMFHHYLGSGYPDPPVALRATQLWMLDPARRLPPGVAGLLADEVDRQPLQDVANWAAFTYQGS